MCDLGITTTEYWGSVDAGVFLGGNSVGAEALEQVWDVRGIGEGKGTGCAIVIYGET